MDEMTAKLKQQLLATDCEERILAVRQLSGLPEFSMELFAVSLGDDDWRVRKAAIETFSRLSHPENLVTELIELLHHQDNAGLRNAAIEILIDLGPLAVASLQREITCPDAGVRKFVIDILGEIGDPRCCDDLVQALSDSDINVRYAAVETLGKLKVVSAAGALLELMKDPDLGLKFTILQSLANIGDHFSAELLFPYLDNRLLHKSLFDCFGKVGGSKIVPFLVEGLSDPMRNVRGAALLALYELRDREQSAILKALSATDHEQIACYLEQLFTGDNQSLKEAALDLYGVVGSGRSLGTLLSCVADERFRTQALQAFGSLGKSAYKRLLDEIDSPDSQERLYLIYVGGELGFSQALPLAGEGVHSGDPQLRFASARALGELGSLKHIKPLLQLLDDEIPDIQDTAASAIAQLGKRHREDVLKQIEPMLSDSDADKRMRAVRILSLIDGQEIEGLLLRAFKDSSSSVRCEAVRALRGHFSDLVISGLMLALTDESSEVRRLAVGALGQCPQDKALPALKLAAGDADLWVRSAVMRTLEHFSGDDVRDLLLLGVADAVGLVAIAALESSASVLPAESRGLLEHALAHHDEEVVKSAMNSLGRLADKNWVEPFSQALLNHSHWDVRAHAAKILGHSKLSNVIELLEGRLLIEGEDIVRQTIESAITCRLRSVSQGN